MLANETRSTGDLLRAPCANSRRMDADKPGFKDGCPITTVLLELAPKDRGVADAGRKAYAARIGVMKSKLLADGFLAARANVSHSLSRPRRALLSRRVSNEAAHRSTRRRASCENDRGNAERKGP